MKEFKAQTGGRYTYNEDILNLQELALSGTSLLIGINNCVLSGCQITKLPSGNINIAAGYVWIDSKVRHFTGVNDTPITNGYYLKATIAIESVKYANDASKTGREVYGVVGQTTAPTTEQYIFISAEGKYPTVEVELFGKYSVIKNPNVSIQTIKGGLTIGGNLTSESLTSKGLFLANSTRELKALAGSSGFEFLYSASSSLKSALKFNDNGTVSIFVGGTEAATINRDAARFKSIETESITPGKIEIKDDKISLVGDPSSMGSIKLNFYGYQGGSSVNRSVEVFNGKGGKLFSFSGSGRNESHVDLQVSNESALVLKNTLKGLSEEAFTKYIDLQDKSGSSLMKLGYLGADKFLHLNSNGNHFYVTAPTMRVSGVIYEGGEALSDKYATSAALTALDTSTVKKDGNKVLSEVNFTQALYDKLAALTSGDISVGGQGYVTAGDVKTEIDKCTKKASNLSDLNDKAASRTNLDVYSKSESKLEFLSKTDNLKSISDIDAARTNLDVYSKEETGTTIEAMVAAASYDKETSDGKYQHKLKDTGWVECTRGNVEGTFSVRARQVGNVVSIQGLSGFGTAGQLWFTLPNTIDPPVNPIGGYNQISVGDVSGNYGMGWKCDPNSRAIITDRRHGKSENHQLLITYIV